MTSVTKQRLTELLREAADAHHTYEKELGERDEDWPSWYAEYIVKRL